MSSTISNTIIGLSFGIALQKSRLFSPSLIQSQFSLTDFTMLSTFLAALGMSQLVISGMTLHPTTAKHVALLKLKYNNSANVGYVGVGIGASLLGVGMAFAGACPGTLFAAIGSGLKGSTIVLQGAAIGVAIHTAIQPLLRNLNSLVLPTTPCLDQSLNVEFKDAALVSGISMLALSQIISTFFPMSSLGFNLGGYFSLSSSYWTPLIGGSVIGLLQFPSLYLLGEPLGNSSALVAALYPLAYPFIKLGLISETSEIAQSSSKTLDKILYIGASISGAFISAIAGHTYEVSEGLLSGSSQILVSKTLFNGNGVVQGLVGGTLLWLGARIAGGCTAGHGISGVSFFKKTSILAVACMFTSGIGTWFVMNKLG